MPTLPPCLETIPDQPIIGVMRPRCEQVRIERNEKHLGKLRVGDYFGEMGLLLEQRPGYPLPRLRSAYALTPNTLLALLTFEVHQLPPPPPPPDTAAGEPEAWAIEDGTSASQCGSITGWGRLRGCSAAAAAAHYCLCARMAGSDAGSA